MQQAAIHFRDYQAKVYGPLLVASCLVNAGALVLFIWAGVRGVQLWAWAFLVFIGPTFLIYKYFVGPLVTVEKLKMVLASSGRVIVGAESLVLPTQKAQLDLAWKSIKAVVEKPELFLIVLFPNTAYFIPKRGMPDAILQILRAKNQSDSA